MTPFGWPQIVVYCTSKDFSGEEVVRAYGSIHVPCQPGISKKIVRMFQPIETNGCFDIACCMKRS